MTAPTGAPAALIRKRCDQNPFYRTAVETPELLRVLELREKAIQTRAQIEPVPSSVPMPPTADDIESWRAVKKQVRQYAREATADIEDLDYLIVHCDTQIEGHTVNVGPLVTSLAKQLPSVMAGIKDAVNRLDGAHTPTAAIAADKGHVWNELRTEHLPQWDAFWAAFDWITAADELYFRARSLYLFDDELASRARIRNIGDVFAAWREPARNTAIQGWESDPRPWPADRVGQLIWVATSGAEVWCPTPRQLRERASERYKPIAATDMDRRRDEFAALAEGVTT